LEGGVVEKSAISLGQGDTQAGHLTETSANHHRYANLLRACMFIHFWLCSKETLILSSW